MKLLFENWRKYLKEADDPDPQQVYYAQQVHRLITSDDPATVEQGYELALLGIEDIYAKAENLAVEDLKRSFFELLTTDEDPDSGNVFIHETPEKIKQIKELRKKASEIQTKEDIESFIPAYLSLIESLAFSPQDSFFHPDPHGHQPDGGYPLKDFFDPTINTFENVWVRYYLKELIEDKYL